MYQMDNRLFFWIWYSFERNFVCLHFDIWVNMILNWRMYRSSRKQFQVGLHSIIKLSTVLRWRSINEGNFLSTVFSRCDWNGFNKNLKLVAGLSILLRLKLIQRTFSNLKPVAPLLRQFLLSRLWIDGIGSQLQVCTDSTQAIRLSIHTNGVASSFSWVLLVRKKLLDLIWSTKS